MSGPGVENPRTTSARDAEFSALALPHLQAVSRIARALVQNDSDADDLVQETYLRAYRYWHTFDRATDCKRWLATICRNAFYDFKNAEGAVSSVEPEELESLAAVRVHKAAIEAGLGDMYARLDLGPAIMKAISALDPAFRAVVVLSDIEEFSYDEIASALGIPVGTVRSRLYRARRLLQEALMVYGLDAGFASASNSKMGNAK